jgi:DNA-binding response OmpR family regulator
VSIPDLAGKRILVVEDESLISMLLEMALQDEGGIVVGPAARVGDAILLVQDEALDGAFLDVNLGGEAVFPVAEALTARGVPFLLLSGYGDQAVPEGRDWPIRGKPFDVSNVLQVLSDLIRKPAEPAPTDR